MSLSTYIDIPYKNLPHPSLAAPTYSSAFSYKPRRSLWRFWLRLSRYQRCVLVLIALVSFVLVFDYWMNRMSPKEEIILPEAPHSRNEAIILPEKPIVKDRDEVIQPKPVGTGLNDRADAIRAACQHAWQGYQKYAWGHDHLLPLSRKFDDWFGLGLTIIDSIDTLYIMGLTKEYEEAKQYIKEDLNFDKNKDVNFFETSIRILGGLLGTYTITDDPLFLEKAKDIGNRLMPAFNSRSQVPFSDVNIGQGSAHGPNWAQDSTVSEVSSVQLEFRTLSRITGDASYEKKSFFVSEHLHSLPKFNYLVPMFISTETGRFGNEQTLTIGARADSYYEYLLKQWIQTGKTIDFLKDDYVGAIEGIRDNMVKKSSPNNLLFVGELKNKKFSPKMDHLVCYLPGTLALGHFEAGLPAWHLELAANLLTTCVQMYNTTETGLSPEIAYFNLAKNSDKDIIIKTNDAHNLLRPETAESLWYMYYFTKNETYRAWAWNMFNAFETYTKISSGGYTSIGNVQSKQFTRPRDKMESFFLGETLKYLYLIFAPSHIQEKYSPRKYVYNTEAHLLPIYDK